MKKILSVMLSVVLIFTGIFSIPTIATNLDKDITEMDYNITVDNPSLIKNNYNKIHFYIGSDEYTTIENYDELNAAKQSLDNYNVEILNSNVRNVNASENQSENLQITIQFKSNFDKNSVYLDYQNAKKNTKSLEEKYALKKEFNEYSKNYHYNLVLNNLHLISNIEFSNMNIIGYAPIVVLDVVAEDISTEQLKAISQNDNVEHISVGYSLSAQESEIYDNVVPTSSWNICMDAVNAYDILESGYFTGNGIRVGVMEANGVCDVNNSLFSNIDITINPNGNVAVSEHANKVMSILCTMVPDAEYYVSSTIEVYTGIQWYIDNAVDIVNCSFAYIYRVLNQNTGIYEPINTYRCDFDGIFDYQIEYHDIVVVAGAGNYDNNVNSDSYNPNCEITSPGYAYNVITVGGVVPRNNDDKWIHDESSCYNTDSMGAQLPKPNISAPYNVNIPGYGGGNRGTSFSAPIVTGCIVMLMDFNNDYIGEPNEIMSVVMATATKTGNYQATLGGFDEKVGAGVINLDAIFNSDWPIPIYVDSTYGSSYSQDVYSENQNLPEGVEITISLTWLAQCEYISALPSFEPHFSNYDIWLQDSYGNVIASSSLTDFNMELLRCVIPYNDRYTISVFRTGYMDEYIEEEVLALTYHYALPNQ